MDFFTKGKEIGYFVTSKTHQRTAVSLIIRIGEAFVF
jgi:hypothetical protein